MAENMSQIPISIRIGTMWAFKRKIISKHFSFSIYVIKAQSTWKTDLDLT